MSGWGCPHEDKGICVRLSNERTGERLCDPGMKGCLLHGRFRFANEDKNRPGQDRPETPGPSGGTSDS